MTFKELLEDKLLAKRYTSIKPFFKIRQSAYDITSRCQLRCEGCFYFQGDKYKVSDLTNYNDWLNFFQSEKDRGINYANIAGAEPALVPHLLKAASDKIKNGTIFTNGLIPISKEINYRIHISIWGNSDIDKVLRGVDCLPKQLKNYKNDQRAIFVYTFNKSNIDEFDEVAEKIISEGHKLTFNFFSKAENDDNIIALDEASLKRVRDKIFYWLDTAAEQVLFSRYAAELHTNTQSLHSQFGCPYPRSAGDKDSGLTKTFRSYRADQSFKSSDSCCIPDTDCSDCRHYAAGSVIVSSKLDEHISDKQSFENWLDYTETLLKVWLLENKSINCENI